MRSALLVQIRCEHVRDPECDERAKQTEKAVEPDEIVERQMRISRFYVVGTREKQSDHEDQECYAACGTNGHLTRTIQQMMLPVILRDELLGPRIHEQCGHDDQRQQKARPERRG